MKRSLRQSEPEDPVVREVRAIRQRFLKQAGGTVKGYLRLMDEMTEERLARSPGENRRNRKRSA